MHWVCCSIQLDIIFPQTVKLILQWPHGTETTRFYFGQISSDPSWTNRLLCWKIIMIHFYTEAAFTSEVFLASTMTYFILKCVCFGCFGKFFEKIDDLANTVVKDYINISRLINSSSVQSERKFQKQSKCLLVSTTFYL